MNEGLMMPVLFVVLFCYVSPVVSFSTRAHNTEKSHTHISSFFQFRRLNKKVSEMNPDLIITYGDTNTTVAGALTAKENNISSIHVESGLRSYIPNQVEEKNQLGRNNL